MSDSEKTQQPSPFEKVMVWELRKFWNGLWVVEWNEKQGAFHVEEAERRLSNSIAHFLEGESRGEWVTLGVFNSSDECFAFTDTLRKMRPDCHNNFEKG